jgi:hypothetical protein
VNVPPKPVELTYHEKLTRALRLGDIDTIRALNAERRKDSRP